MNEWNKEINKLIKKEIISLLFYKCSEENEFEVQFIRYSWQKFTIKINENQFQKSKKKRIVKQNVHSFCSIKKILRRFCSFFLQSFAKDSERFSEKEEKIRIFGECFRLFCFPLFFFLLKHLEILFFFITLNSFFFDFWKIKNVLFDS